MSRVGIRYSKALFQLAKEQQKLEKVESELLMLSGLVKSNPDLKGMLVNPLITAAKKVDIVSRLFKGKLDELTYNFVILICRNKRSHLLQEITDQFRERVLEEQGTWQGQIFCAQALAPAQIEQITKRIMALTGKTVILQPQVDRGLLGGFIVKIKDTIIDLSIKGQLDRLRAKLISG
jgi:F-type H+-transporting ATPase subunit delta